MKLSVSTSIQDRPPGSAAPASLLNGAVTSATTPRTVGVVGLGHMGEAFALDLLADGHLVVAYDRASSRVAATDAGLETKTMTRAATASAA
jgi:phosphoglycerate dehydrogenase-like enzyme